ncbi:MAG: bifunctional tRNA (5-methylaminomethyl-2-thiouridine)(34)-methyltransferase MnmD/FAD-dependent 5-carboxymethylaminomethyl-2-thiouridine(34) oxidoreductase MnmC [Idiomarina sp.]|nr:bifunctional tRNA (5-methylaminomethyl-2-thiouridine)(34)-methyltransferase MnmD/FAD-dependent 5-carboxymethylaminomethyl-2-thiouridine(34) oxidoreductase MnmC [Idiomarina sp.]
MSMSPSLSNMLTHAQLEFDPEGTPSSNLHGDVYFSRGQGPAESRYVFLQQNDLFQRWQKLSPHQSFSIAETGFGTGLNFFLAAEEFLKHAPTTCHLYFVSFEKYPLSPSDFSQAVAQWPEFRALANRLQDIYPVLLPGLHRLKIHPRITLDLVFGDVLTTLPDWSQANQERIDAWFLDGFAPSKNPDMWQKPLYQGVCASLKPAGTFATFTATGEVRRGLIAAGLRVYKVPGFGTKREMSRGHKLSLGKPTERSPTVTIIGGGIAAASCFLELIDHPAALTLVHPLARPADGASGNPQAAVYPALQAQWNRFSEFYGQAFLYARQRYNDIAPEFSHWTGVEFHPKTANDEARLKKLSEMPEYPDSIFQHEANPSKSQFSYPLGGWVEPTQLVARMIEYVMAQRSAKGLSTTLHENTHINQLEREGRQWRLISDSVQWLSETVIICAAEQTSALLQGSVQAALPIRPVRGQVTLLDSNASAPLSHVHCQKGYALPTHNNALCIGATFDKTHQTSAVNSQDDEENIKQFNQMLGRSVQLKDVVGSRASIRATTPDHLPMSGPVVRGHEQLQCAPVPGLWVLSGLGSRGFTSAPLSAAILAGQLQGTPLPCGQSVLEGLLPQRFIERSIKRQPAPSAPSSP